MIVKSAKSSTPSRVSQRVRDIEGAHNGEPLPAASSSSQPKDMITLRDLEGRETKVLRHKALEQLAKVIAIHQHVSLTQSVVTHDCSMISVGSAQASLDQFQLAQHVEAAVGTANLRNEIIVNQSG